MQRAATARADRHAEGALVVWTDRDNQVLLIGAAQEEAGMPAAVAAMGLKRVDATPVVQPARGAYAVRTVGKQSVLQLNGTTLACHPTWDD